MPCLGCRPAGYNRTCLQLHHRENPEIRLRAVVSVAPTGWLSCGTVDISRTPSHKHRGLWHFCHSTIFCGAIASGFDALPGTPDFSPRLGWVCRYSIRVHVLFTRKAATLPFFLYWRKRRQRRRPLQRPRRWGGSLPLTIDILPRPGQIFTACRQPIQMLAGLLDEARCNFFVRP